MPSNMNSRADRCCIKMETVACAGRTPDTRRSQILPVQMCRTCSPSDVSFVCEQYLGSLKVASAFGMRTSDFELSRLKELGHLVQFRGQTDAVERGGHPRQAAVRPTRRTSHITTTAIRNQIRTDRCGSAIASFKLDAGGSGETKASDRAAQHHRQRWHRKGATTTLATICVARQLHPITSPGIPNQMGTFRRGLAPHRSIEEPTFLPLASTSTPLCSAVFAKGDQAVSAAAGPRPDLPSPTNEKLLHDWKRGRGGALEVNSGGLRTACLAS
jgi:hypothetical protein